MVKRQKVTDEQGRRWITGVLDPDTYFADVDRQARRTAERTVAARLSRAAHSWRPSFGAR